jgi:hypothetical protein
LSQAAGYYETAKSVASNLAVLSPFAVGLGFGKFGGESKTPQAPEAGPSTSPSTAPSQGKQTSSVTSSASSSSPDNRREKPAASTSWWSLPQPSAKTLYGLGAVALSAAAMGTAYYRREDFVNGWKYGYDHMTFVKNLWDEEGMRGRLEKLERLSLEHNVRFWK